MDSELAKLLNVSPVSNLEFGYKAGVPLVSGKCDSSEVDLKIDELLIEAKFTEKDFTSASAARVNTYRDFNVVFDPSMLVANGTCESYQLIWNVLAAHHHECRFLLICDARRPDLLQAWWKVHSAIRLADLRARCGFLLWQEIAKVVPKDLAQYLAASRGIG